MSDESTEEFLEKLQQSNAWLDSFDLCAPLITNQEYETAIPLLRSAHDTADTEHAHCSAMAAERLAFCLHQVGRVDEAEAFYRMTLTYCMKDLPEFVTDEQYKKVGKDYKPMFDKIKKIGERQFARNRIQISDWCLRDYGRLLTEQNRLADAADLNAKVTALQDVLKKYEWSKLD